MGFIDFFKPKKEEQREAKTPIPIITPDKEIFDCYAEAFKRDFANVTGISSSEKEEILNFISGVEGGFLNMEDYHSRVYEKYFEGRDWAWLEYEKWNDRFTILGRHPTAFQKKIVVNTDMALDLMSVPELKDLLKSKNIGFSSKVKKQDLIDLAKEIDIINNEEKILAKVTEALEKERYSIYTILMRTINFRSKSPYNFNRAKNVGVKKFEIAQTFVADQEFADMALKENPNALPPLYPYDLSMLKPIINF
ncbi:MAG: hypothetical protein V4495_15625 [Pseudomonadota bacterium]